MKPDCDNGSGHMMKLAGVLLIAIAMWIGADVLHGSGWLGSPAFLGASPGEPVNWQPLELPDVVEQLSGPPLGPCAPSAFTPDFQALVTRHVVIENVAQFRHVWRVLFKGQPFDASAVNFETHFVLLVGGGLLHPLFGFDITDVESTTGEFEPVMRFGEPEFERALAVRVVLTLPGVPPPKKEEQWRVAAATIPREHLDPVILNRQTFAAP